MSEKVLSRCPTCKTRTLTREGQEFVCGECKGRFSAPEQEKRHIIHHMTRAEVLKKHNYYENNKKSILADVELIGPSATAQKWKIPDSTISTLIRRWDKRNSRRRSSPWVQHKHEILADLKALGRRATRLKWKLPPSTLTTLLARWGVPLEERIRQNQGLPPFPEFRDDWTSEVQIKWLDIYAQCLRGEQNAK